MPTSVAIYVRFHAPINFLKLCVFGSITFGVFIILSGLVVGLSGTTPESICYPKMITIAALVMMLILFTIGLYTMFHSKPYHTTCGATCSVLIKSSIVEPRTHARQHSPPTLSTPIDPEHRWPTFSVSASQLLRWRTCALAGTTVLTMRRMISWCL